jgi:hypothetical protein
MTFIISSKIVSALRTCLKFVEVNNSEYVTHILINFNNNQNNKTKMSSASNKRPAQDSGASGDKRQRLSGYDSGFFESEESEPSPEISAGEIKETDSDRRGREKKEREQKKLEEAAERKRQGLLKFSESKTKLCIANIGGKRVEKNGIIEFEGGKDFHFQSRSKAEEATGISNCAITSNIFNKGQSRGIKGIFEGQKVMFINAPVDTSDKVPCDHCNKHYGTKTDMIRHVRAKHPGVYPPAAERTRMPEEYKTFTPPITPEQYSFIVRRVGSSIQSDIEKCDLKQLVALIDGYEPWPSKNIKGAARKYHFTEEQILESIDKNESLTIEEGLHQFHLGLGKHRDRIDLADRKITFSLKHKVSEEDKIKLEEMNNRGTYHKLARQFCVHMNLFGMFANENVTDDNGGLIKNGFEFESHGGLFAPSFDRIEDEYTVNGQTFRKLHYPNPENALENINVVAFMANVTCKASTATIQERYDIYKNKSEDQQKEDFKNVLDNSQRCSINGKKTPLYQHANKIWKRDKCKGAFPDTPTKRGFRAYWQHMLVLLEKQEGLCAVAKIPMSLESGPWLMSCDAIDPLLGHVPDNLRLVCRYNNVIDTTKQNKDLTDTRPTSLTTEIHNEYWRIVR